MLHRVHVVTCVLCLRKETRIAPPLGKQTKVLRCPPPWLLTRTGLQNQARDPLGFVLRVRVK